MRENMKIRTIMAKQSKNRVKLDQQYRKIGIISKAAIAKINKFFEIPNDATTIRSNPTNVLKHNEEHLNNMKQALDSLGITKEGYAEYVAKNYNQIRLGNKPKSIILAVKTDETSHIAAAHLFFDKNENFWLIKSIHSARLKQLEKMELVWEK